MKCSSSFDCRWGSQTGREIVLEKVLFFPEGAGRRRVSPGPCFASQGSSFALYPHTVVRTQSLGCRRSLGWEASRPQSLTWEERGGLNTNTRLRVASRLALPPGGEGRMAMARLPRSIQHFPPPRLQMLSPEETSGPLDFRGCGIVADLPGDPCKVA